MNAVSVNAIGATASDTACLTLTAKFIKLNTRRNGGVLP